MKTVIETVLLCCMLVLCSCSTTDTEQAGPDIERQEIEEVIPQLLSMGFEARINPQRLKENVVCTITENGIVYCYINEMLEDKQLIPHFTFEGDGTFVGEVPLVSDVTLLDFSKPVKLTVKSGEQTKEYMVYVFSSTRLPILWIDTEKGAKIVSKEDYLNAHYRLLENDTDAGVTELDGQIKGRGNSTWSMPKKSYAIKFDTKTEILGMKKHKRWCLLANWMDRTKLRNDIAFQIAKQTELAWTQSGQFVDVILNGKYIGNYYLCEQIKVDKNRVNITEMKSTDIDGDAVTGGYLLEMDINYDEINKFHSAIKNLPYMFKEPDEDVLQPEQLAYFQNYIKEMETYLYADNWLVNREYADYMDIGSFIDWWFVYELTMNGEPRHPKSSYVFKDRLGKLKAGPVWDFDYETFIPSKISSYTIKNVIYYDRLFKDPTFVAELKNRWASYKTKFETIPSYIRTVAAQIKESNENDFVLWPLSESEYGSVNGDAELSFDDAVERIITTYTAKLNWLNEQITNM